MNRTPTDPRFRTLVVILTLGFSIVLLFVGIVLIVNKPPSAEAIAATLAAMPTFTPFPTITPTPAPTLPNVTEALLVCQRDVGLAMHERGLVGAANISGDHLLLLSWVSLDWPVQDLDDALSGVIMGFDAAVEVWTGGCAVYDRVQIAVSDRRNDKQAHRLTVQANMDDLLAWQANKLSDKELLIRLQVTEP